MASIIVEETPSTAAQDMKQAQPLMLTPPEEAAKNIDRSSLFDVSPDTYSNLRDQLEPEALAIERVPAQIEPETDNFLRQSEQHASLASNDIDKMNVFEKRAKYYKEKIIDGPERSREINEIISKKMDSPDGKIDAGEEEYLQNLNEQQRKSNESAAQYGIGDTEDFVTDVLSAGGDIIRSYTDNLEILGGTIASGAVIGGGVGLVTPIPGATVAGVTAGAIKGAVVGSTIVGFIDGYKQTSRSVWNELNQAVDDQGKPLNITHERKNNISRAVGAISGLASGLAGKVFASNNAFLKRFLDPKKAATYVGKSPALLAKMDILGGIAKSALAEGGEEAFQEFTQTVGTIFGKMDESEASFNNALDEATSAENLKKYLRAGSIGAVSGGMFETVTSAPGYKGLKARHEEINYVTQRKKEVLSAQNNMIELAENMKTMKMNELSPNEMSNFTKKVFSSLGVDDNVWVNLEDMRQFSDTPEKAAAVKKAIDPTGDLTKMAQELSTPLQIPKADFLKIITEFPEVSDLMRLTPDGENPLEVRNEGKEFASRLDMAEAKRNELMSSLGVEALTPEQEADFQKQVKEPLKDSKYFNSRESYLDQSAIQPVEGIASPKDVAELSAAQLDARLAIDAATVAPVDARFDRYADVEFRTETENDIQREVESLDKEYATIANFSKVKDLDEVNARTVSEHKKKGFSAFAIDPKSLPEDLKAIYSENPELKKRKAFVEGGIHIEESAILNGFESGADLLKALAETPTKKQIETRIKNDPLRALQKRQEIEQGMEATKLVARDEAFSRLTNAHLKEMKYMASKSWTTVKRGIIKIARPAPTIEALNVQAKERVTKMKIRDINPNAFKQGENKSQRAAVKHFVDGEFEQAFDAKERAALNNELRKESLKAQDKVEKYQKFWKKVTNPEFQQELKDAGMDKTMSEFMELYKLDGNLRGESEQNSFNNFVQKQTEAGNFVPVVPERLNNTQASFKDLSVEQYQIMSEMGQFIANQAKLKNQLMKTQADRAELRTTETIAEEIDGLTKANHKYDLKRGERKNAGYLSVTEALHQGARTSASTVASLKTITAELDEYKPNGFFHNLISKPIKEARTAKRTEAAAFVARDKAIIEKFYGKDFKKMYDFVHVPEFKDISSLGDGEGNIRKVDLLALQAYMGDPNGREAMTNFSDRQGVQFSPEQMQNVLDTHLTENDAAFTQNFLNDRFKSMEQRSFDLHKRTTGVEPDMVKGVPVIHKGKQYPGGYFPIRYKMADDAAKNGKFLANLKQNMSETLGVEDEGHFFASMRAAEMTQQGRLKERTGSIRPLDVNFENFIGFTEEAIHDLNFREVGIDILKVLKNPVNVKNMKAVIGPQKFGVLSNSVKDVVSKTTERESTLYGEQYQQFNKIINTVHSVHAIKTIGYNVASAAIQPASLSNLILRMGPKTTIYLAKQTTKMMANISQYNKYVELAKSFNPDIAFEEDGIDNSILKNSYDFIPASKSFFKNYKNASGSAITKIRGMQKKLTDSSFFMVREADKFIKVLSTLSLSEQFLNGDIEGYSADRISKMSESEKAQAVRSIVQQASDLSLTASATEDKTPLEKNAVAGLFVRYFTDRRSGLNSVLAQADKISGSIKRKDNAQAAKQIMTLVLATGASSAFIAAIRNTEESVFKRAMGADDEEEYLDVIQDTAYDFMTAPIEQTLGNIPFIDGLKYQSELQVRSDYRNFGTPFTGVMSDISAGYVIMKDALRMAMEGNNSEFSDTQRKILLTNAGYLAGGLPTNTMYKTYKLLNDGEMRPGTDFLVDEIKDLHKEIDGFIDMFKDKPEAEEFIQDLKEYKKDLPQFDSDVKNIIPENTKETLKNALSGGQWNKFDKETGAAGIYQFTEERWKELKTLDPTLGLTDNGRVAKDPSQQERAMKWVIQDNTRGLLAYELPITESNLLGAHKFGFDNFVAMEASKDSDKLSDALGEEEAAKPIFKDFKTVGDVKKYLSGQTSKAK